jgi:hypothetical protein
MASEELTKIKNYISQNSRNKIVLCHKHIEGLQFVNVGKELAKALFNEDLRSSMIAYTAEESLYDIFSSPKNDSQIGDYVGLDNIGILFEPELGFNLKSTLDNASTNKTILICWDGVVQSDKLFFLQPGDGVFIDLKGLSYIEI